MKLRGMLSLFVLSVAAFLIFASGGETGATLVVPPWTHTFGLHRVTENQLRFMSAFKSGSLDAEAVFCTSLNNVYNDGNRVRDDDIAIFGLNRYDNIIIYTTGRGRAKVSGKEDHGVQLSGPADLTGDDEGNIFVADTGNNRIVHLRMVEDKLVYINELDLFDGLALDSPSGVDFSGGFLFIADTGNDRIVVTRPNGITESILKPVVDEAMLDSPVSVSVVSDSDEWVYYKNCFVAVVDSSGHRIWKIGKDSGHTRVVRYSDMPGGDGAFNDLDMDYYSNIYVTDRSSRCIYKFDRNLNHIITLGRGRQGGVDFDEVRDISINRRFGQVVILEKKGLRYFWVGTDILDFKASDLYYEPSEGKCQVEVSFLVTEHSVVDIFLEDKNGDGRLYFAKDFLIPGGRFNKRIEVRGVDPIRIENYRPRLVTVAKPTYSSVDYIVVTKKSSPLTPAIR